MQVFIKPVKNVPLIQFGCFFLVCPLLCFFLLFVIVCLSSLNLKKTLSVESACLFSSSFVVHWSVHFPGSFPNIYDINQYIIGSICQILNQESSKSLFNKTLIKIIFGVFQISHYLPVDFTEMCITFRFNKEDALFNKQRYKWVDQ